MYETKKIPLLSACLLLHANVPDGNTSIDGKNLSANFSRHFSVTQKRTSNVKDATPSVKSEKTARLHPAATPDKKPVTIKNMPSKGDKDDAFRNTDRLEEQTDAVTSMLQQQLFAPYDGNLILQTVKKLPKEEQLNASAELIAAALKVRLGDALKKICMYDTHALDTLTMQLAEVICRHGVRQKRRFALFSPEDIRYMTAGLYRVLQETDIEQLIVF